MSLYVFLSHHPGLWFDLEVSYTGSFLMTLETKLNLARLGKEGEGLGEHGKEWLGFQFYLVISSFKVYKDYNKISETLFSSVFFEGLILWTILYSLSLLLCVCFCHSPTLFSVTGPKMRCLKD